MTDQLESDKNTAIDFYNLIFNKSKSAEAIEKQVGDEKIRCNKENSDGKKYRNHKAHALREKRIETCQLIDTVAYKIQV